MRKVFDADFHGQDADAWSRSWGGLSVEESVCSSGKNSYLGHIFKDYFRKGARILEGGCGTARHVVHYKHEGMDIVGIDFSPGPLVKAKSRYPEAPLGVGSVEQLPFKDNSFDVYYSGGVVEHFEEGPFLALKEARRVLKDSGILIITVPFINLTRRLKDAFLYKKNGYILTDRFSERSFGSDFHLYAFTMREFSDILGSCGFRVLFSHGCSVSWGMRGLPLMDFFLGGNRKGGSAAGKAEDRGLPHKNGNPLTRFLKDIFVYERRDKPYLLPIISLLQSMFGNLAVFVCEAQKGNSGAG